MKRVYFLLMALIVFISTEAVAGMIEPARVRYTEGEVMYHTPDSGDWLTATANIPLDEGDSLWCAPGSRAELQLPDGTFVRIDGGSQLNILAIEESSYQLNLSSGRLYVRTSQNNRPDSLQIDADDTTVIPAARTRLRLDMLPNGQEDVSIFKGSAYVEGNGSRTKVRAGEHIALEYGHNELLALNPPDNWESWNRYRDSLKSVIYRAESNLPEELRSYSGELDANGQWIGVPEYGMVWRPTVTLGDEWAPYRAGRWLWRGNEYVWVSAENWGWVPYHYGRWTVVANFGWCWIPPQRGDVYWGPGYVGWYRSGSHVGWTPLAPGEKFYGYGNYGRHSVNVTTVNINVKNFDYKNRHQRGGLTALPQSDFVKGRVSVVNQPAVNASFTVSVGSPRLQPVRQVRAPEVRSTPPRQERGRVEHNDSRELRPRFPRVKVNEPEQRKQLVHPVVAPSPVTTPAQVPVRPQVAPQAAAPVPAPARPQNQSPQNAGRAPVKERPQQLNPPVQVQSPVSQSPPQNAGRPFVKEQPQRLNPPAPARTRSAQPDNSGKGAGQRIEKQKRVWRVNEAEPKKDKAPKAMEQKERERK